MRARCVCDRAIWVSKGTADEFPDAILLCHDCALILALVKPDLDVVGTTAAAQVDHPDAADRFKRRLDRLKRQGSA